MTNWIRFWSRPTQILAWRSTETSWVRWYREWWKTWSEWLSTLSSLLLILNQPGIDSPQEALSNPTKWSWSMTLSMTLLGRIRKKSKEPLPTIERLTSSRGKKINLDSLFLCCRYNILKLFCETHWKGYVSPSQPRFLYGHLRDHSSERSWAKERLSGSPRWKFIFEGKNSWTWGTHSRSHQLPGHSSRTVLARFVVAPQIERRKIKEREFQIKIRVIFSSF